MNQDKIIRIGTRESRLALAQTDQVIAVLRRKYPELNIEKVILRTKGDKILNKPLLDFGGKGVFITEFEEALLQGKIDLAVHSAKDMPMELSEGLVIAGVLARADVRDILVVRKGILQEEVSSKKDQLPDDFSWIIGTGSLRRQLQLKMIYPEVQCISIRGNVPTRLQKIRDGVCDGVVLAAAGLERLGLLEEEDFDYHYFSCKEMVPAGGQGIIAIEGREGDKISGLIGQISDRNVEIELQTERRMLELLNAGCHEAVGVFARVRGNEIEVQVVREKDGIPYMQRASARIEEHLLLVEQLAKKL